MGQERGGPKFSVVVSSYNRAAIVERCVQSVLASDFPDYELIVVDDGSTDGTVARLSSVEDPRLRIIEHDRNRGMSHARSTGSEHASGEWVVMFDSDWELEPFALSRMAEVTAATPAAVRVLWFRLRWGSDGVSPARMPEGTVGYEDKLIWWNSGDAGDAVRCVRREIFQRTPYPKDRRGMLDTLYELDLAKHELAIYYWDIVGTQHVDAPNSWLRAADPKILFPRMRNEAADMLWLSETTLERHVDALARLTPGLRLELVRAAALHAFILGRRRLGLRYGVQAVRSAPGNPNVWATLLFGLAGPWLTLRGVLLSRVLAKRRLAGV